MKWENQNWSKKVHSGEAEMIVWNITEEVWQLGLLVYTVQRWPLKMFMFPVKKAFKALEVSVEYSRLFCQY